MRRRCWLIAAGILLPIVSGCDDNGNEDDSSVLAGTSWRLRSWSVSSSDPSAFVITAQFTDTTMSGRSAVNTYGGTYSATSNGGFSTGPLAMTEMAGTEPAMQAEAIYFDLLGRARRYAIAGDELTLSDESGNALLTYGKVTASL